MTISQLIENLQRLMTEKGDLECWYAIDDEGNGYHPLSYEPSFMYMDEDYEMYNAEDIDGENDYEMICIVN